MLWPHDVVQIYLSHLSTNLKQQNTDVSLMWVWHMAWVRLLSSLHRTSNLWGWPNLFMGPSCPRPCPPLGGEGRTVRPWPDQSHYICLWEIVSWSTIGSSLVTPAWSPIALPNSVKWYWAGLGILGASRGPAAPTPFPSRRAPRSSLQQWGLIAGIRGWEGVAAGQNYCNSSNIPSRGGICENNIREQKKKKKEYDFGDLNLEDENPRNHIKINLKVWRYGMHFPCFVTIKVCKR